GVSLSYIYDGLSTTVTNVLTGQNTTKTADASGCLIQNTDAGGSITYTYNAMGQVRQVISPSGTNQIGYDQFGHQTSLSDSNAGNMTYDYNVYGELTLQTDALNNSTSLTYDDIGRVYNRNENSLTTNWVYNSNGRLDNETTSSGITYTYTYDTKGRPSNIKETESNVFRTDFNTSYAYNDNGQISKVTYPSGFAVDYHYTNGYLDEIIRDDNQASIWKLNSVNARGQITSSTAGNGMVTSKAYDDRGYLQSIVTTNSSSTVQDLAYSFSAKGYLEWRKDNRHNGITESFGYDNLGRLETINTNGTVVEMTYAANGNIGSKSDAGTYAYSAEHPNAVETLTGNNGTVSDQEQDITYTLFNMPSVITEGSNSATFTYGPEHERKIMSTSVSGGLTKYYSGNYERQDASGATRELNYIVAYGQIVGIFEKKSSGETNMYYVHTDHLSSLNVITDASGNIAQETSYDAWGNRRDPATLQNLTTPPANLITDRGFTGQEHMDAFGLINMNGRIYDPVLGRFLSPDPIVADPTSTQDYNRYSYCGNSPLMYTDPSGYIKATQYRGIIGVGGGGGGWGLGFDWWMNEDDFLFPKMGTLNSPRNTLEYDTQLGQNIANETGDISYLNSVRDGVAMGDYNGRGTISYSGFNGVYFGKTGKIYLDYNFASTPDAITGGFSEDNEKYTIAPGVGVGRMAIDPSIFGNAQSQGGGHSFMDYLNFGVNAGDLYYSVKGEALHNELYWVQKNGTIRSTNSIGNNYLLRRSYNITGELAEGAKIAARNFAYVGTAMSGINMVTDFRFANTFDFAMGLTTFIPGVGWAISGLYFISNVAVQAYTGKTIGEHLEMQINKIGQ
ncbi:MAG TPA: RHS repeat-associated core domain-containing protein, partial [Bacteroidales bacterium]